MTLSSFCPLSIVTKTPGPGAYDTDTYRQVGGPLSTKNSIRPRYSKSEGFITKASYITPRSSLSHKRILIKNKPKGKPLETSPGPSYYPDPLENFSHYVKIKSKNRGPNPFDNTPGPGDYTPIPPTQTSIPAQGPRAPIVLDAIAESPGPAAYDVPRPFGHETPSFTIRPRTSVSIVDEMSPGYLFNNLVPFGKDSRKISLYSSNSVHHRSTVTPGPGSYNPNFNNISKIGPSIRPIPKEPIPENSKILLVNVRQFPEIRPMTISEKVGRSSLDPRNDTPGPQYLPSTSLNMRKISIHERFPNKHNQSNTPGPSDYNPMDISYTPAFSVKGPSVRDDWYQFDRSVPGPGSYSIQKENELPKWTIGSRTIQNRIAKNPQRRSYSTMKPKRLSS